MSTSGASDNGNSPSSSFGADRLLTEEELEPYVRRRNATNESRKRLEGLNEEEQNVVRTSINSRERKRMHDLNDAMEELRACLPDTYTREASSRRLSKINTLLLACNWIRQLKSRVDRLETENATVRALLNSVQQQRQPVGGVQKEDRPPSAPETSLPPSPSPLAASLPTSAIHRVTTPLSTRQESANVLPSPSSEACAKSETFPLVTTVSPPTVPRATVPASTLFPGFLAGAHANHLSFPQFPMIPFVPLLPQIQNVVCKRVFGQPCTCIACSARN